MAPQKGKQGTKGQKQIVEENSATLSFYRNMMLGANGISFAFATLFRTTIPVFDIIIFLFALMVYIACYQFMAYMAKPRFSDSGQLLDGGIDLNMEQGIAEHMKDLIILTGVCQVLALITNYFWLLWLLAPIRAFHLLWTNILAPWIFQPAPEVDEKKQKKLERKMRRH